MSAISSVSSGAQTSLLQQLQQNSASGSSSRAGFFQQQQADVNSALQSIGVDASTANDLQSQIQNAVQTALSGTSSSGTDKRTAVQNAVDGVLKQNGIDPAKFQDALKAQEQKSGGAQHAHHKHGAKTGQTGSTSSTGQVNNQAASLLQNLVSGTTDPSTVSTLPAGTLVDVAA